MGAWGPGPFDNDTARDWLTTELSEVGAPALADAIGWVADAQVDDYVDADGAWEAVAAAEVVAALCGRPSRELPDDVKASIPGLPKPDDRLIGRARLAVERALTDSELTELWRDAEPRADWEAAIRDLLSRLR